MEGELYRVERLVDRRITKKGAKQIVEYLVKWEGYPMAESTWEPEGHLECVRNQMIEVDKLIEREEKFVSRKNSKRLEERKQKPHMDDHINEVRDVSSVEESQLSIEEDEKIKRESKQKQEKLQKKQNSGLRDKKVSKSVLKSQKISKREQKKQKKVDKSQTIPTTNEQTQGKQDEQTLQPPKEKQSDKYADDQQIISSEPPAKSNPICILKMERNEKGEFFYLTIQRGLKSYRPRDYIMENHKQQLLLFYESKMTLVPARTLEFN